MRSSARRARAKRRPKPHKQKSGRARIKKAFQQLMRFLRLLATPVRRLPWWADVLTVIAFGIFLYQVRVSLVPAVQPDTAISSSWLDLPITVRNPGEFFDFKDVQFFWDMTEQQFEGGKETGLPYDYYRVKGLVEWPLRQPPLILAPGNTTSFPCNIAADSALKFAGVPLPMRLIHLSIKIEYSINLGVFRWHRQTKSQTFTWKQVSGGWQWLPGETLSGPN
jgi:hypothetical protein